MVRLIGISQPVNLGWLGSWLAFRSVCSLGHDPIMGIAGWKRCLGDSIFVSQPTHRSSPALRKAVGTPRNGSDASVSNTESRANRNSSSSESSTKVWESAWCQRPTVECGGNSMKQLWSWLLKLIAWCWPCTLEKMIYMLPIEHDLHVTYWTWCVFYLFIAIMCYI